MEVKLNNPAQTESSTINNNNESQTFLLCKAGLLDEEWTGISKMASESEQKITVNGEPVIKYLSENAEQAIFILDIVLNRIADEIDSESVRLTVVL